MNILNIFRKLMMLFYTTFLGYRYVKTKSCSHSYNDNYYIGNQGYDIRNDINNVDLNNENKYEHEYLFKKSGDNKVSKIFFKVLKKDFKQFKNDNQYIISKKQIYSLFERFKMALLKILKGYHYQNSVVYLATGELVNKTGSC